MGTQVSRLFEGSLGSKHLEPNHNQLEGFGTNLQPNPRLGYGFKTRRRTNPRFQYVKEWIIKASPIAKWT